MGKKVFIIISSMWGHVYELAKSIKEGIEKVEGISAEIYQVAETLPEAVTQTMHAKKLDVPVMDPRGELFPTADAYMFGIPTRYGVMCAQMKTFWDATGGLWSKQSLAGKPAGVFISTNTQHGGQETTALTTLTHFAHHGMIFVPLGYSHPHLFEISEVVGGSPYGSGTVTMKRDVPTKMELELAVAHGEQFAKTVARFN